MIRTVTNKSGEFIVVNAYLEVKEDKTTTKVPVYIQVDVTTLNQNEFHKVFKGVNSKFNPSITLNLSKPVKNEKSWWKKLFN